MHPTLVGPIMATHLKIKEFHSRGHTKAWESLTPTGGAMLKLGKLCPARLARAQCTNVLTALCCSDGGGDLACGGGGGRDVLEERKGERGGLAGPPSSYGPPYPGSEAPYAPILLRHRHRRNFAPNSGRGGGGGWGGGVQGRGAAPMVVGRSNTSLWGGGGEITTAGG